MVRGDRLQISDLTHDVDWQTANQAIRAGKTKVVVEMVRSPREIGGIRIPEGIRAAMRGDVGVVLSVPKRTRKFRGMEIEYPKPGTLVCVWPEDGTWIEGADMGDYEPAEQVRVYGVWCEVPGSPHAYEWWQSIVCEVRMSEVGNRESEIELVARVDKLVVKLDSREEKTESGLYLSDDAQVRNGMGTVLSVGEAITDCKVGDRVCLDMNAVKSHGLRVDLSEFHKDVAVCDDRAILYVLQQAA